MILTLAVLCLMASMLAAGFLLGRAFEAIRLQREIERTRKRFDAIKRAGLPVPQ